MNMKGWLDTQLKSEKKSPIPILSFPCISLMGVTVKELVQSSKLQARGMQSVAERIPSGAVVSMMDLSVEAEAFGSPIRMEDNEIPAVIGSLVHSQAEANALQIPAVGSGRTGKYIEAIRMASESINDRPVFAGMIGPFSLAGRLMGVTEALMNCYDEPDMVHTVLRKATDFLIKYAQAYKDSGADGIVMAEPLTGMLSPALAEEFSETYVKEIIDAVQDDNFIVIYHNCGNNTILMIDSLLRTGAYAYHFGNSIEMLQMLEKVPSDVIVMGNIDPAGEFCNGTPESIRAVALSLIKRCGRFRNFIISSGCDIPPATPWENIDAFFDAVREYYDLVSGDKG